MTLTPSDPFEDKNDSPFENGSPLTGLPHSENSRTALICILLSAATLSAYWQVTGNAFIHLDDPAYITQNPHVRSGLTLRNIIWAFTSFDHSNWHPVTWLSHMLDVDLFGLNPGMHHLVNLLLHTANVLLLFGILKTTTGAMWRSAAVAALFALHPLHVESVAWAAERKDVLCSAFWLLTLWRYTYWVDRGGSKNYTIMLAYFSLALMAKPMAVTLPFALLLVDVWPLGRLETSTAHSFLSSLRHRVTEKLPLFALSAASCVVTVMAQHGGQAVRSLENLPALTRITHILVSYLWYVEKALWPSNLAILYPHPGLSSSWKIAAGFLLLAAITLWALRIRGRHPFALVGWLWFLGTLVPVIGIVQVGSQGMADRYAYIPSIGLFVAGVWGVSSYKTGRPGAMKAAVFAFIVICAVFTGVTRHQVRYWRNSIVLFEHTLAVTGHNYHIYNNLGLALMDERRFEEAVPPLLSAVRMRPFNELSYNNLGTVFLKLQRTEEAIASFRKALDLNPAYGKAHVNLGIVLLQQGKPEAAREAFEAAREAFEAVLTIRPDDPLAHYFIGTLLDEQGDMEGAERRYRKALAVDPYLADAHNNLGILLVNRGLVGEAVSHYRKALAIRPDYAEAHNNLGVALFRLGHAAAAKRHFDEALGLKPDFVKAGNNAAKVGAFLKEQAGATEGEKGTTLNN